MVVNVRTQKGLVYTWVGMWKGHFNLSSRETAVAKVFIHRYIVLRDAEEFLVGKAKEDYNAFEKLKTPNVLRAMCGELNISFIIFRKYLMILKEKGVIMKGGIDHRLIPDKGEESITLKISSI